MGVWWLVSCIIWVIVAYIAWRVWDRAHFESQGVTTVRLKINRKIFTDRLVEFLEKKERALEDRQYGDKNDIVKVTYTDKMKRDWGGSKPTITFEYDEKNSYLYTITVEYNRRKAKKAIVFRAEKIKEELHQVAVFDEKGEDVSAEDLAQDKREAIEEMIRKEEEDAEEEEALEKGM